MITVFTPTYNRAYTLEKLYQSLLAQTHKEFEWLIVDDGSTDETEKLVSTFVTANKINIRYFKQANGGKHRAINKGVIEAKGNLFFIVDSDDFLLPNALQKYSEHFSQIQSNTVFAGVSGRRIDSKRQVIGTSLPAKKMEVSTLELRMKHGVTGDMAEAYKTEIMRKFPFPDFEGEYFCPEALIWNRIAQNHKMQFFNEGYYVCEYLPDGLTAKITEKRMRSPNYSLLYYSELYRIKIPFKEKLKAAVNFWRFGFATNKTTLSKYYKNMPIVLKPLGWLMHKRDKSLINQN